MSNPERLKQLLKEAKDEVEKMEGWMKSQEPEPGVSYQDWGRLRRAEETTEDEVKERRTA
jgi:hypothetical protein